MTRRLTVALVTVLVAAIPWLVWRLFAVDFPDDPWETDE